MLFHRCDKKWFIFVFVACVKLLLLFCLKKTIAWYILKYFECTQTKFASFEKKIVIIKICSVNLQIPMLPPQIEDMILIFNANC